MSWAIMERDSEKREERPGLLNTADALIPEVGNNPESPRTETPDLHDGGFQAWLYVLGGFFVFINIW